MTQYIKFAATVYIILAVLILVTGITGCDKLHMERVAEVKTTQITWIKETPQSCGNVPGHINACATSASDYSWCVIRMPENTPDSMIAEEFRHCFGEVHPK